ncbi:MAG: hypothetical protein DRG24_05230 [Epsilonproteobacteria bacterium]|nr:MAG: hypothetical protein DRG24_05230 [Campylobacterota bacterium]
MRDIITITITNQTYFYVIHDTYQHLLQNLPLKNPEALTEALQNLLDNVVQHAYEDQDEISLTVRFSIESRQLQIDVEDAGLPFDFSRFMREPIHNKEHPSGFFRIYNLVDRFWFTILHNKGKRFSVIQSFVQSYDVKAAKLSTHIANKSEVLEHLIVRSFKVGDGDGIAKLIYKNYDYTYFKSQFYEPEKIRTLNLNGQIHSIIAEYKGRPVGHFGLVMSSNSDVAEIGIAAVDPDFKKMGIMNKMFDYLILKAKALKLRAFYGEAIMLHPYSQKANLAHGMIETAIILGEVPATTEIEHKIKTQQRSGSMVAFLVFDRSARYITHSKRYHSMIYQVYHKAQIAMLDQPPLKPTRKTLSYHTNSINDTAVIIIEENVSKQELLTTLDELYTEHCEMIYADINLHHIDALDKLISLLNRHGFFYCGVMLFYYHNEDYLRLQRKNSKYVEEDHLVSYSSDAKKILDFIIEDERRIRE